MIKNILIVVLIVVSVFLFFSRQGKNDNVPQGIRQEAVNRINEDGQMNKDKTPGDSEEKDADDRDPVNAGRSLDLSNQNLDKLPSYVLNQTSLEELDISNNNLTGALPAEIRQLRNLRVLNASNNNMTGVPAEVGQLENLEVLDLSDNKLTGLPYELGNLKNLKTLNLSGNDYAEQDLEIIKKGLSEDVNIIVQ